MRCGEAVAVLGQEGFFRAEIGYSDAEDRPTWRGVAERSEVTLVQRPLPRETLVLDLPFQPTVAGRHFHGLRQRRRDPPSVRQVQRRATSSAQPQARVTPAPPWP